MKNEIPVALQQKREKFNLDCDHQTSDNFMQPRPIYYRHCIKGEKIDLSVLATVRPMPITVPTYGRMRLNLRAFFVPFSLVFPNFSSYYVDSITSNYGGSGIPAGSPRVTNDTLWKLFTTGTINGDVLVNAGSATNYDLIDDSNSYWVLTSVGRRAWKILQSLGYAINPNRNDVTPYSALALLCWAKIYVDRYANSQYMDSSNILNIQQLFKFNDPLTYLSLTLSHLESILGAMMFCTYDSNPYFEASWDNPVSPNSLQFSYFQFSDVTGSGSGVDMLSNGTPEMQQNAATSISLGTEYLHRALSRLTEWQHRHALAGARNVDRWLAQYGMKSKFDAIDRVVYVGSKSIDINVGDVLSTAETSNGKVGDYAGKAFGQGGDHWTYDVEDYGIFMVVSSILPSGGYVQGMDRNNMHLDKFDFFQPEADSLSVQAIQKREFYVSNNGAFGSGSDYNGIASYIGRYAEYKRPVSWWTGDTRLNTYAGGDSWNMFRLFNDSYFSNSAANITHSLDFTKGSDWARYNRIFDYTKEDFDKFFSDYHFNVCVYAPARPMMDTFDWDEMKNTISLESNNSPVN